MADESVLQTVKRNVMPEVDTSNTAKGPGHAFDADSPQAEGEAQYKESLGSPLEVAYGKMKKFLGEHEQHLSDKVLKPFRAGLDNMAEDLQNAADTGTTKSGGQLTPTTRALVGATGEALKMVPVGGNVKDTAAAMITPPELKEEEALDFSKLAGHKVIEEAPEFAYRARPVGQKGVVAGERPVATSSIDKAHTYAENLETMTGTPHEVVRVPLKKGEHTIHVGPDKGEKWYSFKKDVPEESIKPHKPAEGSETDMEYERRTRTERKTPAMKPIKFGEKDVVKEKPDATKGLSDKNKIVIEGVDEPKANPEGRYSDKVKIDPFAPTYKPNKQPVKTA